MLHDSWPVGDSAQWPHFDEDEMACQCGCGKLPEPILMIALEGLRLTAGIPLPIASGARCPAHNAKASSTGLRGPHTTGLAADISIERADAIVVIRAAALNLNWTGWGFAQKGNVRFLHLDMIPEGNAVNPRPALWTY